MLEKVNAFKEALKDKAKNVWVMKNLDPKKEDSIWYNGDNIVYVEFEDVDIFIQGVGDIYVEVRDANGEEIETLRDKSNHGVEPTTFSNDEEMLKLIQEGRLEFHNNNWFETLYKFNDSDYVQSTYDIVDNVSDALDPGYILEILEYVRRNKEKEHLDENLLELEAMEELRKVVESQNWYMEEYDSCFEFSQSSPAGEDFNFSINKNDGNVMTAHDLVKEVKRVYNNFDPEEHVESWIRAKHEGITGIPGLLILVEDSKKIENMLCELKEALEREFLW